MNANNIQNPTPARLPCVHGIRHPHECRECSDLRHRIAALVEQAVKDTWEGADTYMVGLCIADKIADEVRRG